MTLDANQIIEILHLEPLAGEGGLFRQTYQSQEKIPSVALPERYRGAGEMARPFGTAIFYLLTNEAADDMKDAVEGNWAAFSAFHRLPTDEIFHFYLGDPLELSLLLPDGSSRQVILGQDLLNGQKLQAVAPSGAWQGTRLMPGGRFALIGTTMAPGFIEADYEQGERDALLAQYPQERERILALTR